MLYEKDFSHLRLFLRMLMSIGREGTGRTSPDSGVAASEPVVPAAAEVVAAPEGVNVPRRERVMPSIEDLKVLNAVEKISAERREKGETPMGKLELIAKEADARAQETLVAQNKGFLNRVTNVAKGAWKALSGFASFINKDIVLPVYDALADFVTGRKENGELVGESTQKIEELKNQISTSEAGAERDALEKQLAEEQDQLDYLRDPRNAARAMAEREKATAAAEKAEGKAFAKSEAERIAAEDLAAAVAKAKEAHAAKLERERIDREGHANLGRGTVIILSKLTGTKPEESGLSEDQILALGSIIDGAKKGIIGAINLPGRVAAMPGRVATGLQEYKDGEVAKAQAAYELTKDALYDMTLGEDRAELWAFTKGALSFTGALLLNKKVQEEVLDILDQKQEFGADGKTVVKNRGTADVLANAIKDGTVQGFKDMGLAIVDAARDIRDSEAAASVKKGVKNTAAVAGAGAGGYAVGTAGMAAAPFVFMGAAAVAPYMLGAAAGGAAAYGTYRGAKKGYEVASAAATRQLEKMTPGIVDTVVPMVEAVADLDEMARNLPGNTRALISKVGGEVSKMLIENADAINEKTRRGLAFYNDMKAKIGVLSEGAQIKFDRLYQEALTEVERAKHAAEAAELDSAIEARAAVDAEAAAETSAPVTGADVPEPASVRSRKVGSAA